MDRVYFVTATPVTVPARPVCARDGAVPARPPAAPGLPSRAGQVALGLGRRGGPGPVAVVRRHRVPSRSR
jgi:hypothetical protein